MFVEEPTVSRKETFPARSFCCVHFEDAASVGAGQGRVRPPLPPLAPRVLPMLPAHPVSPTPPVQPVIPVQPPLSAQPAKSVRPSRQAPSSPVCLPTASSSAGPKKATSQLKGGQRRKKKKAKGSRSKTAARSRRPAPRSGGQTGRAKGTSSESSTRKGKALKAAARKRDSSTSSDERTDRKRIKSSVAQFNPQGVKDDDWGQKRRRESESDDEDLPWELACAELSSDESDVSKHFRSGVASSSSGRTPVHAESGSPSGNLAAGACDTPANTSLAPQVGGNTSRTSPSVSDASKLSALQCVSSDLSVVFIIL